MKDKKCDNISDLIDYIQKYNSCEYVNICLQKKEICNYEYRKLCQIAHFYDKYGTDYNQMSIGSKI